MDQSPFQQDKAVDELTPEEALQECANWRNMWSWLDDEARYWIGHIGLTIRVMGRDFKPREGTLGKPKFDLHSLDINIVEVETDYVHNKSYLVTKTTTMPFSGIAQFDFIVEKEDITDELAEERLATVQAVEEHLPF